MIPQIVTEQPLLMSVSQAARLLNISERLAWSLIARREIASVKLGGRTLIPRSEVERIVANAGG